MKYNQLGNSELFVSEVGFGCMSLPCDNPAEAQRIIDEAIDRGINFFDTADLYNYGLNEELVGKSIAHKRDKIILASKVGNHWEEGVDGWFWDPSKAYIKNAVKDSLKRLKTDYIDLYQLHGGTIDDPIMETIEAFEELKKEGLIRYYGISSIRPNVIRTFAKHSDIVSVMMQYSILDRRPEEEMFQFLAENNISVIARGPLSKGILTGKGKEKIGHEGYLNYTRTELLDLIRKLEHLKKDNRDVTQLAIQFCLAHPAVATTIPGASKLEQLLENIETINCPALTLDDLEKMKQWSKAAIYEEHR